MAAKPHKTVIHGPTLEKRFLGLRDSPDSINRLSAWCLQKRYHARDIINVWLKTFKKGTSGNRLTLLYLANDVIQTSTHKHIPDFLDEWRNPLMQAVPYVRGEDKIVPKIERVFNIWIERRIYSKTFCERLLTSLNKQPSERLLAGKEAHAMRSSKKHEAGTSIQKEKTNEKLPEPVTPVKPVPKGRQKGLEKEMVARVANFQSTDLVKKIQDALTIQKVAEDTERRLDKIPAVTDPQFNVKPDDYIRTRLKDRGTTENTYRLLNDALHGLSNASQSIVEDLTARQDLILEIETAIHHYRVQEKEAKTVAAAYDNYLGKILKQKNKVGALVVDLPSPLPSPNVDAPSPSPDDGMEFDLGDTNSDIEEVQDPSRLFGGPEKVEDIPLPATMPSMLNGGVTMTGPLTTFLSSVSLPGSVLAPLASGGNNVMFPHFSQTKKPPSTQSPPPGAWPPLDNPEALPPVPGLSKEPWDASDGMTWGEDELSLTPRSSCATPPPQPPPSSAAPVNYADSNGATTFFPPSNAWDNQELLKADQDDRSLWGGAPSFLSPYTPGVAGDVDLRYQHPGFAATDQDYRAPPPRTAPRDDAFSFVPAIPPPMLPNLPPANGPRYPMFHPQHPQPLPVRPTMAGPPPLYNQHISMTIHPGMNIHPPPVRNYGPPPHGRGRQNYWPTSMGNFRGRGRGYNRS